ncbi:hypothetical protein BLNAU_6553 [Blattamonas nauphoetae]|uniref:Uncharacterized protein n=1 Tax=Blattamonas nauphoetae TaxID=2049346 RepID=A0ABQ9Y481_9EUKA|nr:hypothetical protein BLNAU_6553 [Blattamonas nauphoetae]
MSSSKQLAKPKRSLVKNTEKTSSPRKSKSTPKNEAEPQSQQVLPVPPENDTTPIVESQKVEDPPTEQTDHIEEITQSSDIPEQPTFVEALKKQAQDRRNADSAKILVLEQLLVRLERNLDLEREKRQSLFVELRETLSTIFTPVQNESLSVFMEETQKMKTICEESSSRLENIERDLKDKSAILDKVNLELKQHNAKATELASRIENSLTSATHNEAALHQQIGDEISALEKRSNNFFSALDRDIQATKVDLVRFITLNQSIEEKLTAEWTRIVEEVNSLIETEKEERKTTFQQIEETVHSITDRIKEDCLLGAT